MGKKPVLFIAGAAVALAGSFIISMARADSLTLTTSDGMTFMLRDSPCGEEISSMLKEEYREQFRGATASYAGQSMELCWMGPDADNDIILINKHGQGMAIPMKNFMRVSAVKMPKASI